ncbi:hypothetical protein [Sinomicrobium soli]|uniref:hypothetical protein n=1 Tax=Sinomicrobium sp. N-1-3-6 TaxID=2219864 RepID=UPI000DCF06B5|nr:hypothetical protein [Sinomicrobium sp. N-1-3-6]RAV29551.1 hypothetical protein DN748_08650 [Sinomicrobium sp. N-1-3-6]
MGKTVVHAAMYIVTLCLVVACSGSDDKNEKTDTGADEHTYHIVIDGGKTYTGGVAKSQGGVFWPFSLVEYSDETGSKVLAGTLLDAGKFQVGVGFTLDENNKPGLEGSGPGLVFGEWGSEHKYTPAGEIDMTIEHYKEHDITFAGASGTGASYTLKFEGTFKSGQNGEPVKVTGTIVSAAP